jgi:hypothetical protein
MILAKRIWISLEIFNENLEFVIYISNIEDHQARALLTAY